MKASALVLLAIVATVLTTTPATAAGIRVKTPALAAKAAAEFNKKTPAGTTTAAKEDDEPKKKVKCKEEKEGKDVNKCKKKNQEECEEWGACCEWEKHKCNIKDPKRKNSKSAMNVRAKGF